MLFYMPIRRTALFLKEQQLAKLQGADRPAHPNLVFCGFSHRRRLRESDLTRNIANWLLSGREWS